MTSPPPPTTYLYMLDEDLYRLGNSASPKLENVRYPKDVDTYALNGILMVRSNGKGISLITEERLERESAFHKGAHLWKIPACMRMPKGLALFADTSRFRPGQEPDHYLLCPQSDMPLVEYAALLSKLALQLEWVRKL